MSLQNYASVDENNQNVLEYPVVIESSIVSAWGQSNNPKAKRYLPYIDLGKPSFDPATQEVIQNGWTINPGVSVNPVWQVVPLTTPQLNSISAQNDFTALQTSNFISACNSYIALPSPTNAQTQQAVLVLVKFAKAIAKQNGIFN